MYKPGSNILGQNYNSINNITSILTRLPWNIKLFHKSGGLKKNWIYGQDQIPIKLLKWELNEKLCGAGNIDFSFLDFPIDSEDYIEIYYNKNIVYRAFFDSVPDLKGGKSKLEPYSKRFDELLYNGSFTDKTITYIFQTVINSIFDDTGIIYNNAFVDITDTTTITIDYSYEKIKKIFDDLITRLDDSFYGVNASNIFVVYKNESTISKTLFNADVPFYSEIQITRDNSKIKNTRSQVFKKSSGGTGSSIRVNEVGYGGSYPVLAIEKLTRKKELKDNISELLTNEEALDFSYAKLTSQEIPTTIKIKDNDLSLFFPEIGQRIKAQDREELINRTILYCDALTEDANLDYNNGFWTGATLDSSDYIEGSSSVEFTGQNANDSMYYDFDEDIILYNPQKIGFMIKSTLAGNFLTFDAYYQTQLSGGWGLGTWGLGTWGGSASVQTKLNKKVNIPNANRWFFIQFDLNFATLKYVRFYIKSFLDEAVTINIDRIQIYQPHRDFIEGNIKKIDFELNTNSYNFVDMELNTYDNQLNDTVFQFENKIKTLEAIQQEV